MRIIFLRIFETGQIIFRISILNVNLCLIFSILLMEKKARKSKKKQEKT